MRRSQVIGVAIALGVARLAAAAPSVGVVVTGDPSLQTKVRAQVASWIGQHGFVVTDKALAPDALKTLTNCFVIEDMSCARSVIEHQATATYVVFVRADLVGGKRSKEATLVAYWFLKNRDAVADKRSCKPCSGGVLAKVSSDLMTSLYDQTGLTRARLTISEPPKLVVMIDGVNVGLTPLEQDVAPGSHTIALVRDDITLGTTTIDTVAGDVTEVKVPIASPDPVDHAKVVTAHREEPASPVVEHRSHLLPGFVILVGAGGLATGGTFLYYGHKGGPNDPLIYPNATKQGAIIAGVGGAVLITGLLLWWHASTTSDSSNGPTASVGPGGTMVGWTGQF